MIWDLVGGLKRKYWYRYVYVHWNVEPEDWCWAAFLITLYFMGAGSLILANLASQFTARNPCLCLLDAEISGRPLHPPRFFLILGIKDPHPHICMVSALPPEPSPHPWERYFNTFKSFPKEYFQFVVVNFEKAICTLFLHVFKMSTLQASFYSTSAKWMQII